MKRHTILLLSICWISLNAFAQSIEIGRNKEDIPHPVDLTLDISVDHIQNHAPAGLTVQLYDQAAMGPMSQISQLTDSSGRVLFRTVDGTHQVRISGSGIEPFEVTVQVMR